MADTYASLTDVQTRYDAPFLQRIVWDKDAGEPAWGRLTLSLEDATAEIDSYITAKYEVPLNPVPHLVMRMCVDIAIYHTALTSDKITEEISNRYKGWVAHLDKISKGQIGLGIRATQEATDGAATPAPPVGTGAQGAVWGRTLRT